MLRPAQFRVMPFAPIHIPANVEQVRLLVSVVLVVIVAPHAGLAAKTEGREKISVEPRTVRRRTLSTDIDLPSIISRLMWGRCTQH